MFKMCCKVDGNMLHQEASSTVWYSQWLKQEVSSLICANVSLVLRESASSGTFRGLGLCTLNLQKYLQSCSRVTHSKRSSAIPFDSNNWTITVFEAVILLRSINHNVLPGKHAIPKLIVFLFFVFNLFFWVIVL